RRRSQPWSREPSVSTKKRNNRRRLRADLKRAWHTRTMAKDTEKLIRQLSLISYLMAERRPVTALQIWRDVEGYSGMNEEPLALQQISWGRPSPLRAPDQRSVALGLTASAGGHELSQRLAKIETAIFRNKTVLFDYYTMERDETGPRKVDPYHLLYQGGQFYLLGYSHERGDVRQFRLSRI